LRRRWSLRGREVFGVLSPSYRACEAGFRRFRGLGMTNFLYAEVWKKWRSRGSVSLKKHATDARNASDRCWVGRLSPNPRWRGAEEQRTRQTRGWSHDGRWRQRLSCVGTSSEGERTCVRRCAMSVEDTMDASVGCVCRGSVLDHVCRCDRRETSTRRTRLLKRCRPLVFEAHGHVASHGAMDAPIASVG
jgi:hypothetical protein